MSKPSVGGLELAMLLAVSRLARDAYGLAIRRDLTERLGREYASGAIYTTLQRLEDKGLLTSTSGEPLPIRGGRARRVYALTGTGARAIRDARREAASIWSGVRQKPEDGMMMHIRPHPRAEAPTSRVESALRAIGVHPTVAEQFWGDVVENYRKDVASQGSLRGAVNLADEVLRSLPHLAWSVARDGGPAERARLAACVTGVALVGSLGFGVAAMRKGPPAQLVLGGRSVDKVVVNHRRGAQLPIRVVDAHGHRLDSVPVSYRWIGGAPLAVSRAGVVTCTEAGDAVVRASAGQIAQQLMVQCRPVQNLEAITSMNFMVGDPPQKLSFAAVGLDGRRVSELRGFLRVRDTTIARLSGVTVTPLRSGTTAILVDVGEVTAKIHIHVREVVKRLTGLGPGQRSVVVPISLGPGDTARFALPQGSYWLSYRTSDRAAARPTMIIDGACAHGDEGRAYRVPDFVGASYCRVQNTGGYVTLTQATGAPATLGQLALQFVRDVR